MGLHRRHLGHSRDDRALDLLCDIVRVIQRQLAGELQVEGDLEPARRLDGHEVVDLAHRHDTHRRGANALGHASVFLARRLDVNHDIAAGKHALHRVLDVIGSRVPLTDDRAGRDTDHDIRERVARSLAQPQPAQGDRRLQRLDRRARRVDGVRRGAIHQHVDVAPHQPRGRKQHQRGDEECSQRVSRLPAGPHGDQPEQHRGGARQVAREMERVREQRGARVRPRRTQRYNRPSSIDREHDTYSRERPPRRAHIEVRPAGEPRRRKRRDPHADKRERARLGQRRQVLGLTVAVRVARVRGLPCNTSRAANKQVVPLRL